MATIALVLFGIIYIGIGLGLTSHAVKSVKEIDGLGLVLLSLVWPILLIASLVFDWKEKRISDREAT